MKKIKKRGAVYGVVALLLCTAAYLNWSYVEPPADLLQTDGSSADSASAASDDGAAAGEDYFASSRLTREKARDEAVSTLKELSESADADETAKEDAASQISALAAASVQEANIESLIRAKGYADAVVMLSDGSANIVVSPPEGGLQADDVTKIRDIVVSETGHERRTDQNRRGRQLTASYFSFSFCSRCDILLLKESEHYGGS